MGGSVKLKVRETSMKIGFFALLILLISPLHSYALEGEDTIINRTIKIEGSVEKPRTIFIVPKALLWKEDIAGKRFVDELLKPVYPEHSGREEEHHNP